MIAFEAACPACEKTIELPSNFGPLKGKTIACIHCGEVLRIESGAQGYCLRLLSIAEGAGAHHEVMERFFKTRAVMRDDAEWTAGALAMLLVLHGHLAALAEAKEDERPVVALADAGGALAEEGFTNAVERVLIAAGLKFTGLTPATPTEEKTDDPA